MCHNRSFHHRINRIHERSLRIVYKDDVSTFEQLLKKSKSVTIHNRNLQCLATEIYKAINNLSSALMHKLFKVKDKTYNLRNVKTLARHNVLTTGYGLNSISYLAPKIWDIVPTEIKIVLTR